MYCEYCDTNTADPAEARRHILSIRHIRNKNIYELDMNKYFERSRQARLQPVTFVKLCEMLNMRSEEDVLALDRIGFFKMDRLWHHNVAEELHRVLHQSCIEHNLAKLLPQVREKLLDAIREEDDAKTEGGNEA